MCSCNYDGVAPQGAGLQIFPCTVSQLLSAYQFSKKTFTIYDLELNQVSIVGVVRGFAPFVTYVNYSVDDMTGPPLNVKQWVNTQDCDQMVWPSAGTYVKVIGSLHDFGGQRSLLAMDICRIKDLNEITSHMLEVVQAHMQLYEKQFDMNMNATAAPMSGGDFRHQHGKRHNCILPSGLSSTRHFDFGGVSGKW